MAKLQLFYGKERETHRYALIKFKNLKLDT